MFEFLEGTNSTVLDYLQSNERLQHEYLQGAIIECLLRNSLIYSILRLWGRSRFRQ
jgi:hypothetical protein